MKRVFVCSPLRGDVSANVARTVALCRAIALGGDAPLAPHLYVPQALEDADPGERAIGMRVASAWLEVADEVVVAGPVTDGMRREIEHATQLGIPVRFEECAW